MSHREITSRISLVIPTYERPSQLGEVLNHVLASDTDGIQDIEIIVVDDGSKNPAKSIVESIRPLEPFRLRYVFQENAGPAKARNRGFCEATNEIVLFIDDDILVNPDLLNIHVRAHLDLPGIVVFGKCPFVVPDVPSASYRFLSSMFDNGRSTGYERVYLVASGNLSVEREMFLSGGVYKDGLRVPAAEEFELEYRLNSLNIPIYLAHEAIGWHLQPSTISDKCGQEFKYGVGAAEVSVKLPEITRSTHISGFLMENGFVDWSRDPIKRIIRKIGKSFIAGNWTRSTILSIVNLLERIGLPDILLFRLYRLLCGISLFAGVRQGIKIYRDK